MNYENAVIVPLATARLTRLITVDQLGDYFLVQPVKRRAVESGNATAVELSEGLECHACMSMWSALVTLAFSKTRATRWVVRALAVSYVATHLTERLDHDED